MKPLVILSVIGVATLSHAQGVLDQSYTPPLNGGANIDEAFASIAQTFTAGLSGTLYGVNIDIFALQNTNLLQVKILGVAGGVPDSAVLGSTTLTVSGVSLGYLITFPQTIPITAGTQYAIAVDYVGAPPPEAGNDQGIWYGDFDSPGLYSGGNYSVLSGESWSELSPGDLLFNTYVSVPEPDTRLLFAFALSPMLLRFAGWPKRQYRSVP